MHNLLTYRFTLTNLVAMSVCAVLWTQGVIQPLFAQDTTYISHSIVVLFAIASIATWRQALRLSGQINCFKSEPAGAIGEDKEKALAKLTWLKDISGWLTGLGLLGTVVGFAVALNGVNQGTLGSASCVQSNVAQLVAGMRIAVNTTIIGAALGLWHELNVRMLWTAADCYWTDRISTLKRQEA
jgi:hypothetical protein